VKLQQISQYFSIKNNFLAERKGKVNKKREFKGWWLCHLFGQMALLPKSGIRTSMTRCDAPLNEAPDLFKTNEAKWSKKRHNVV
jgi:hypothetical protein